MTGTLRILCLCCLVLWCAHQTGAAVLLEDDFSDGVADGWTEALGTWSVIGNEYVGVAGGPFGDMITLAGQASWSSYTFDARMKLVLTDPEFNDFGLIFHAQSASDYLRFTLGSMDERTARISHIVNKNSAAELATVVSDPIMVDGRWYDVRLVVHGNHVSAFVDGTLVAYADGLPLTQGYIGLTADDPTVYFDDILVAGPTSADPFVGSRTLTLYGDDNISDGVQLNSYDAEFTTSTSDGLTYTVEAGGGALSLSMTRSGSLLSLNPRPQDTTVNSYMLSDGVNGAFLLMGQEPYDPLDISIRLATWAGDGPVLASQLAGRWAMTWINDNNLRSNPSAPFTLEDQSISVVDVGGGRVEVQHEYSTWTMEINGNVLEPVPGTLEPSGVHVSMVTDGHGLAMAHIGVELDDPTDVSAMIGFAPGPPIRCTPVYRFWSPVNKRHFYTIRGSERQKLIDSYPHVWTYEGLAYYALPDGSDPNSLPVYRFWSAALSAHFYTIDVAERDKLINLYSDVWTYEGPAFYAYPAGLQPSDASPVYRFWSNTLSCHFYTIRESERDKLINLYSHVWTYEGVAWYAYE